MTDVRRCQTLGAHRGMVIPSRLDRDGDLPHLCYSKFL